MTRRVLITRSQPGANGTATVLARRGYLAIVEPLLKLEPIAAEAPAFDALAFTSVNGVRQFQKLSARRDTPVWCVGDRTASEARAAGFDMVHSAAGSVSDLVMLLADSLPADSLLLHAGNEESRGDLAGELAARGGNAIFLPIYRSLAATAAGPALSAHLKGENTFDCILIHSPKAGAILKQLALAFPERPELCVAAISPQAALELSGLGVDLAIAVRPNEEALIEAMEGLLGRG